MSEGLLLETLKKEKTIREKIKKGDRDAVKNFSWVPFFAGEEFNQTLTTNQEIKSRVNLIDFEQIGGKGKE
jgi:hypothetical protein